MISKLINITSFRFCFFLYIRDIVLFNFSSCICPIVFFHKAKVQIAHIYSRDVKISKLFL